jgi:thiol:disulfide interchange protein
MKHVLFAAILLCTGNMVAQNRSITFESATFDQSLAKAKQENKLVFVDCMTSWCGPCKQMDKFVFTKDSVADFFNSRFVNLQIDMEKGEGPQLAKEFHVEAYPTC